ncbi:hypothetical protein J4417_02880 [Candidatus Woesearchaeota archaeon]|nr:hypothetical protein [Candidatus Woesearchaeota archaeon]
MDKSHNRIIVSSSLRKIEERIEVEESIKTIDDVLRELAKCADQTQSYLSTREQGGFLEDELNVQDLETVGMYHTTRRLSKTQKTISFSREKVAIEFCYARKRNYTLIDSLTDVTADDMINKSTAMEIVTRTALLSVVAGEKVNLHHRELELGKSARTLDPYVLVKVEVVNTVPLKLCGIEISFIPTEKREVVYQM